MLELGNIMFNQNKNQTIECPRYVVALLEYLDSQLSRVYWNKYQKEYDSPFRNTSNQFINKTFEVHAYSWDEENPTDFNFKYYAPKGSNCRDIEISWYKYLGRDTTINQELTPEIFKDMFNDCLDSILKMDSEEDDTYKICYGEEN